MASIMAWPFLRPTNVAGLLMMSVLSLYLEHLPVGCLNTSVYSYLKGATLKYLRMWSLFCQSHIPSLHKFILHSTSTTV